MLEGSGGAVQPRTSPGDSGLIWGTMISRVLREVLCSLSVSRVSDAVIASFCGAFSRWARLLPKDWTAARNWTVPTQAIRKGSVVVVEGSVGSW